MISQKGPAFSLFLPPYQELLAVQDLHSFGSRRSSFRGGALVWSMASGWSVSHLKEARSRPPGLALLLILPPARLVPTHLDLLAVIEEARPHTVLPFHSRLDLEELRELLRRGPADLPVELTDYLAWRGLDLDRETRQLVREVAIRSAELKTVNAVARSLYTSRRALGRRFLTRGLPVPSHWLQFCRVLRATIKLQACDESLFEVACDLGYPDGFALSNQMHRLIGLRPSTVRKHLGWEWVVEAWLRREEKTGGLEPKSQRSESRSVLRSGITGDP